MFYNTSENDLFAYFEIINQIEPDNCLDFGPFLKLSGCISRQVKNVSIPNDLQLIGVDFFPNKKTLVYNTIYNALLNTEDILSQDTIYDLAISFNLNQICDTPTSNNLFKWIISHCKYFFTDLFPASTHNIFTNEKIINVGDKKYYLYINEGKR